MPIFNVTIGREVIEKITVAVEADSISDIRGLRGAAYYELIAPKKNLSDWISQVNDVWLDEEKDSRKKQAELVVKRNDNNELEVKIWEDPRQIRMFPKEDQKCPTS